jgi:hypothetical protein
LTLLRLARRQWIDGQTKDGRLAITVVDDSA